MRLLLILLVISIGAPIQHIYGQDLLNTPIPSFECQGFLVGCLSALEEETNLRFAYKQEDLEGIETELSLNNAQLSDFLTLLQNRHALKYEVLDGHIFLSAIEKKKHALLGVVRDEENGEVIAGARIVLSESDQLIYSDENGLFRWNSALDSLEILIIKEGYQFLQVVVNTEQDVFAQFKLQAISSMQALDVRPAKPDGISLNSKSFDEINPKEMRIASFGGEVDALSNLRLSGGLQNVGLGDPGLIVRGGGPDQNFILIDGIPVYNTFHILGLYSIFNGSNINSIKLYKDAFPSRYGSRLSSVVDVNLFNGNKEKLQGDADIGIISSGASINGPLIKEKLSFSFSARRTYADLLTKPAQRFLNRNEAQNNTTGLWYYDVFGKLHFQPNDRHQFKLSLYNGGDELQFDNKLKLNDILQTTEQTSADLRWRNSLAGLQWHAVLNSSLFMKVQSAYSSYSMDFSDAYTYDQIGARQQNEISYSTGLEEWRNSIDFDLFAGGSNHLLFGAGYVLYGFKPFVQSYHFENRLSVSDTSFSIDRINTSEVYAYLEENIYTSKGVLSGGIRLASFLSEGKRFFSLQPRLYLTRNLNNHAQLRLSLTDMAQFLHLLPNNNLGLPIDIWLPVVQGTEPLRSFQFSSSLKLKYLKWEGGLTLFAKNYRNLIEHRSGSNFLLEGGDWRQGIESGTGSSAGLESQFKLHAERFELTASYTFCRSTRVFSGINEGGTYFSKYDRPHSINLFVQIPLGDKSSLSWSFSYASGNPVTIPSSRYIARIGGRDVVVEEITEVNNYRLPATHHLDVAYNRSTEFRKIKGELTLGIYNLYNQLNPFMVYIGLDQNVEPVLKLRSYLPMMPMLKYRISF